MPPRYQYRLTEYDPALQDEAGAYGGDDWTRMAQIGQTFGGVRLTLPTYLEVEAHHLVVVAPSSRRAGRQR